MRIASLTILGGRDKSGAPELERIDLAAGDTCCLVGPTGSGKSRLLADIEWLAQGDTPTARRILLDGRPPNQAQREGLEGKWVAQITQNMNFVLDMSVMEFLRLHADSLGETPEGDPVEMVVACANQLCGEPISPHSPLTSLSGGQSRSLMIADVACLGQTPVVLLDEIENAGIHKTAALRLFSERGKILLLASHDPLLILQAQSRVVIRNGGMVQVVRPAPEERECVHELLAMDLRMAELRSRLRAGLPVR